MPGATPIYGFPYPDPSDLVANYPALGQQLAEDIEDVLPTLGGLVPITPTSIASTGGSSSVSGCKVTFSGVSEIALNGCFTSSNENYRVIMDVTPSGVDPDLNLRFRSGGTNNTSANYQRQRITGNNTTIDGTRSAGQTLARLSGMLTSVMTMYSIDFMKPQLTSVTGVLSQSTVLNSNSDIQLSGIAYSTATSFDGFTVLPASGNITGTIRVYGYSNS